MRRSRLVLVAIVLAVVAAIGWSVMRNGNGAVEVTVEPVRRAPVFRSTVTASGQIVATRYADIGSNVMGKIVALPVKEGDRVKAGQLLARIDPVQARAEFTAASAAVEAQQAETGAAGEQIKAARADVAAAEARYVEAGANLKRVKDLHAEALTPRSELDAAQASYDAARAQVEASRAGLQRAESSRSAATQRIAQARAQAARARDIVSKTEITSPIDGIVSRLQVREGEMVVIGIQNQPGTTLMTVSDLSAIDAEVKVAEADVLRLALDQKADVVLEAIPGRRFPGRVVEIGASALPVIGTQAAAREFKVVIRLDQADASLRPGLTCDAEVLTEERQNVLTVPLQSVVLRGAAATGNATAAAGGTTAPAAEDRAGVFVVNGDNVAFQPVATGIIGGLLIEVTGVAEGATVVTGPFQALRELQDGRRVRVRK